MVSFFSQARKQILKIHTEGWVPKLNDDFISELAEKCVGKYCIYYLSLFCNSEKKSKNIV